MVVYFKIVKRYLVVTVCFYLVSCGSGISGQGSNPMPNNANPYLVKPTGPYGVGFKDMLFIDESRCPDVFYVPGV
ncbi:MAG TPA: hypothetical protein VKR58_13285, partial [Aquella sp.]|nr:hypothetical protein [Aquella sp.]